MTADLPAAPDDWTDWVSAGRTRNHLLQDPLLDWLEAHGRAKGFFPDDELPGHDGRTDMLSFLFRKGNEFEAAVLAYLAARHHVEVIAQDHRQIRDPDSVARTFDALRRGVPIVAQGVLWNSDNRTFGAPDLLVRSDVLHALFPRQVSADEAAVTVPALPGVPGHYRVVDVKFTTLRPVKNGHAPAAHRHYMAQVWVYNEALGHVQGWTPPAGFLLGRAFVHGGRRTDSALAGLERVDHDHVFRGGETLSDAVERACAWVRRVRRSGASWSPLPEPSVDELRPNMRHNEDAPWHRAKQQIAAQLEDLTLLPRVNPQKRAAAMAGGVTRWSDPGCCASLFDVKGPATAPLLDAVIAANRPSRSGPALRPARVTANEHLWREPRPAEFYVDFETVSDIDDDFAHFPQKNGQPLIFMIGCGHLEDPRDPTSWNFSVFTADLLTEPQERRVIDDWLAHMHAVAAARGTTLEESRLFHWSPAERSFLVTAYNAAAARHGHPGWFALPWVDLLTEVVRAQPVTVRGAFGFGLKAVAKALHAAGLTETTWSDGPADGLGAMVGAWWCHHEAQRTATTMRDLELMREIASYNEVDCRAMAEVLAVLRRCGDTRADDGLRT